MTIRICNNCGEEFEARSPGMLYCTKKCYNYYRLKIKNIDLSSVEPRKQRTATLKLLKLAKIKYDIRPKTIVVHPNNSSTLRIVGEIIRSGNFEWDFGGIG